MSHSADSSGPSGGPSRASSTATSLITRLKQKESAAWERFAKLYTPLVYGWCRRAGLREDDAADVTQDVFLAVARNIPNYDHDGPGASFRGWLRVITTNKLNDVFRRAVDDPAAQGGSTAHQLLAAYPDQVSGSSSDSVIPSEQSLLVRRALTLIESEFEPRTWQAFWKTVIDARAPTDVAVELAVTPNAVRKAKARVLHRLRGLLADEPA